MAIAWWSGDSRSRLNMGDCVEWMADFDADFWQKPKESHQKA